MMWRWGAASGEFLSAPPVITYGTFKRPGVNLRCGSRPLLQGSEENRYPYYIAAVILGAPIRPNHILRIPLNHPYLLFQRLSVRRAIVRIAEGDDDLRYADIRKALEPLC